MLADSWATLPWLNSTGTRQWSDAMFYRHSRHLAFIVGIDKSGKPLQKLVPAFALFVDGFWIDLLAGF